MVPVVDDGEVAAVVRVVVTAEVVVNVAVLEVEGVFVNVGVDVGDVQPIRLKVTKNVTETKPHLM